MRSEAYDEDMSEDEFIESLGIGEVDSSPPTLRPIKNGDHAANPTGERFSEEHQAILQARGRPNRKDQEYRMTQQALDRILSPTINVYSDPVGGKAYIRILPDNIVEKTTLDWVVQFASKPIETCGLCLKNKELREHIETWSNKAEKLHALPPSFSTDDIEITFRRILISVEDRPSPTWDYWLAKCGPNAKAVMAFTWSLFEKRDKSQQFLFLKGQGQDGKGSYVRWLESFFGDQLVGLSASDKYWPALCVGRRIGVFNDLNNTQIVMSSQFKQITGGDKVSIEQKYEKTFSTTLDTKFILTTNRSIGVINDKAERRRAIMVAILPDENHIDDFEVKLKAEGAAFLFKCKAAYHELYDEKKKSIACDYSAFDAESGSFEELNEVIFEKYFVIDPKGVCPAQIFFEALRKEGFDNNKISGFKEWLERTHNIRRSKVSNGTRSGIYKGMKRR